MTEKYDGTMPGVGPGQPGGRPDDDPEPRYVTVGKNYLTVPETGDNTGAARQRNSVHIERPIFNQSQFDEGYHGQLRHVTTPMEYLHKLKKQCLCTPVCIKDKVLGFLPFIRIFKKYNLREDLLGDIVAGITVGIMQIPQGMAYAMLASVPPVIGLYVSFFPALFYFFLGTSRQMSLGTFAVVDLMVGAAVDKRCGTPAPPGGGGNMTTIAPMVNSSESYLSSMFEAAPIPDFFSDDERCRIGVATCVTFMAGVIQIAMGVLQLGFITTYLSEPLTRGFTTGCACHVFTSQVKSIFGLSIPRYSGAGKLVKTYIAIATRLFQSNVGSLITSAICIVLLVIVKEFLNPIVKRKLKAPFPIELIVVILGTVASYFLQFKTKYDMKVVGPIPSGIPPPEVPHFEHLGATISDSIVIAVVAFAISVSMAKLFAKRNNYEIDANQELYAYGITNVGSSFFHCFVAACSLSRSVVQDEIGGKTQLASVVAAGLILIVLYFISQLFEQLPTCVLAAIILVALKGMFLQLKDLKRLWKVSKIDMIIWLVAFLSTALLDVDLGLIISLAFCLLTVVFRTQRPHVCRLGWVPQTDLYKDIEVYPIAKELPGIKIIRMEASLYYANSEYFVKKVYSKTGVDPKKLVIQRKKKEKKAAKLAEKMEKEMTDPTRGTTVNIDTSLDSGDEGSSFDRDDTEVKHVIIDCTTMGYVDSVGVSTLLQIVGEYKQAEIEIYLAGCKAGVREMLEKCEFYDKTDKAILYLTVHDAVLGALAERPELLAKTSEDKAKCAFNATFSDHDGSKASDICPNGQTHISRTPQKAAVKKGPYYQIRALLYKLESGRHRRRLDSEPDNTPLLNNSETNEDLKGICDIKGSGVFVVESPSAGTKM